MHYAVSVSLRVGDTSSQTVTQWGPKEVFPVILQPATLGRLAVLLFDYRHRSLMGL